MNNTPFKRSSISEMCKQIVSAPVVFKKKDGTECLAFYNNEDSIKATKLYIMFPDSNMPKYIEGNDLYNLRENIIYSISDRKAISLYNKVCQSHKAETVTLIRKLIDKAPKEQALIVQPVEKSLHEKYNKKHACILAVYKGKPCNCYVKDLTDFKASELIIDNHIEYNVEFDCVLWAAGISSKDFTALKVKLREIDNA